MPRCGCVGAGLSVPGHASAAVSSPATMAAYKACRAVFDAPGPTGGGEINSRAKGDYGCFGIILSMADGLKFDAEKFNTPALFKDILKCLEEARIHMH